MAKDWRSITRNLRGVFTWRVQRAARRFQSACEFMYLVVLRNAWPAHAIRRGSRMVKPGAIVGMVRLRNEAEILVDTLDHLSAIVDGIVVYDDASEDGSGEIALRHPKVLEVIHNRRWRARGRVWEETANRRKLYQRALRYQPSWVFYADADERFDGDIRSLLTGEEGRGIAGLRVNLFSSMHT